MTAYLVRRILSTIVLLILILTAIFFLMHLLPGDPAQSILGGEYATPSPEQIEQVRDRLGLNEPLPVQYVNWLTGLAQFDLGHSFATGEPVTDRLMTRLGRSLLLAGPALVIAIAVGIPMGVLAARWRRSFWDPFFSAIALFGFSTPQFVSGLLLVLLFAITLGWLPSGGYVSPSDDFTGFLKAALLPVITLSLPSLAIVMRMARSAFLEEMGLDYVRTARSKGLREINILSKHVLRNAVLPVITIIGLQFGNLVTGSVIVEFVFSWPGIGSLLLTAVGVRDYPIIQGVMLFVATAFILVNFLTDMSYAMIDPRIRYR